MIHKHLAGALLSLAIVTVALPSRAQELTLWSWRQEDKAAYDKIIRGFEAANPGITIKFQAYPPENYATLLTTALAGGTGPEPVTPA